MKAPKNLGFEHIAPCGVNCLACSAYLKYINPCKGCRSENVPAKRKSCANCVKKNCCFEKGFTFCFECSKYPCAKIKGLSKRYLKNYKIDLIQNGFDALKDIEKFLEDQLIRCTCPHCGGIIDQHHLLCCECGAVSDFGNEECSCL